MPEEGRKEGGDHFCESPSHSSELFFVHHQGQAALHNLVHNVDHRSCIQRTTSSNRKLKGGSSKWRARSPSEYHRPLCPKSCCGREQQLNYGPGQPPAAADGTLHGGGGGGGCCERITFRSFLPLGARRTCTDGRKGPPKRGEGEREQNYQRRTKTSRGKRGDWRRIQILLLCRKEAWKKEGEGETDRRADDAGSAQLARPRPSLQKRYIDFPPYVP